MTTQPVNEYRARVIAKVPCPVCHAVTSETCYRLNSEGKRVITRNGPVVFDPQYTATTGCPYYACEPAPYVHDDRCLDYEEATVTYPVPSGTYVVSLGLNALPEVDGAIFHGVEFPLHDIEVEFWMDDTDGPQSRWSCKTCEEEEAISGG